MHWKIIRILILLLLSTSAIGAVQVKQANRRFFLIEADSLNVKAVLDKPYVVDRRKVTLCSIEARSSGVTYFFFIRRAVPYEHCFNIVVKTRRLLKRYKRIEILGNRPLKDESGYSSSFEMLRAGKEYVGYFGNDFSGPIENVYPEFKEHEKLPIDPEVFP